MTARGKHAPDRGRQRIASLKALRDANGWANSIGPRGRGAPARMALYHTWLVADLLLRRKVHTREPLKASCSMIGEKWGVTRTVIDKSLTKHRAAARELLECGVVDEVNTGLFADAFRKLEDGAAVTTGIRRMRGRRNT